jgi:hypothetical protein
VIADICCDLGIMPGNLEPEQWRELFDAIVDYGGSLAVYLARTADRLFGPLPGCHAANEATAPQSCPPVPFTLATGPP